MEQSSNRFVFVIFRSINDYLSVTFEGYSSKKYQVILDRRYKGIINFIYSFHHSVSMNRKVNLPLKKIWYPYSFPYKLLDTEVEEGGRPCFVFFQGNRLAYEKDYINYLRIKYPMGVFVFRFVNVITDASKWVMDYAKERFDEVISMDSDDCIKYKLTYVPNTFWIDDRLVPPMPGNDVLFMGFDKGRHEFLLELSEALNKSGISHTFIISGVPKKLRNTKNPNMKYVKSMKYLDYLGYVKNARAVLEIVSRGQKGSTLRAFEAVSFHKLLLTNNESIREENFYNAHNMKVYGNVRDILDYLKLYTLSSEENVPKVDHDVLFEAIDECFM